MKYYQEKIETDSKIPAKIYIGKAQGSNCHYPLHWHNNLEFDLVLKGKIKGKIAGKQVTVQQGDFFFVNSGDLHETDADDRNCMSAITILLSYELIKEYCPNADAYYYDFNGNDESKKKIINLIQECARLYERQMEFYDLELSIALRKICCILLKECRKERQEGHYGRQEQKSVRNLKKAIAFMEDKYSEEISLKRVADEIGMTPTYFSRFIKRATDETFYGYLAKIRAYHAYLELINGDASITEIALNNGFSNVKAFIETFKKIYHITPSKYRKQFLEQERKLKR